MDPIYEYFEEGFRAALAERNGSERRIGAELKFPMVNEDGTAVSRESVDALWDFLKGRGWTPVTDSLTGKVVGARKPGDQNDTVASCETGYCKPEFSLAHVSNLHELLESIHKLRQEIGPFSREQGVCFLGYGIQPVTPPSHQLLMKQARTSVWDKVFPSNRHIPKEYGDDVHLFTINAASHVHVSVSWEEAIPAVNVLNGFAGAQIALTANSNIWQGKIDPEHKCVAEKFWDWWMPDGNRVGVPEKPFEDMADYVRTVASLKPVYVKRDGIPIVLEKYDSFAAYYADDQAVGVNPDGRKVELEPEPVDIDLHSTCYWHNARISHYYTVENRANDQQPPADLICVAALTLGLTEVSTEFWDILRHGQDWDVLRQSREAACREGPHGMVGETCIRELSNLMLELARWGLRKRGLGEEDYLSPLESRAKASICPADENERLFRGGGISSLIAARRL